MGKDLREGETIPTQWIVVVSTIHVPEGLRHAGFLAGALFALKKPQTIEGPCRQAAL